MNKKNNLPDKDEGQINRRGFLTAASALTAGAILSSKHSSVFADEQPSVVQTSYNHKLPKTDYHYNNVCGYIEETPVPEYTWASAEKYEEFNDLKFGIRLHWGPYSINHLDEESWPFLTMSLQERQAYQELYKSWNPQGFDAQQWVDLFAESGAKMFSFTTKHHDGFSMYDTQTHVKRRVNWLAPGGPALEDCELAYSIMESPFKRDVVKELCDAARTRNLKVDLYFSHPDWYDADFRPYNYHPLQVPGAEKMAVTGKDLRPELDNPDTRFGKSGFVLVPKCTKEEVERMMERHRAQLEEIITRYGDISMVCLDQWLGPEVWPMLRETMIHLRRLRPDVMFRARGIGNYGDYYTPERFVPENKENSDVPWFVIYPLATGFSYDGAEANYKGSKWIVHNLIDAVSKGGNFMVGIGPDGNGEFHKAAIAQLKECGVWMRRNSEGIFNTKARAGHNWKEGDNIRYTKSKDGETIYAFCLGWPGESLHLRAIEPIENINVSLLGAGDTLRWVPDSEGIKIHIPAELKSRFSGPENHAYCFKIAR